MTTAHGANFTGWPDAYDARDINHLQGLFEGISRDLADAC